MLSKQVNIVNGVEEKFLSLSLSQRCTQCIITLINLYALWSDWIGLWHEKMYHKLNYQGTLLRPVKGVPW